VSGRKGNDCHPGGAGRFDPRGRVFDHQALGGDHAETRGRQQVDIGTRLAAQHILGTDQNTGDRQTRAAEAIGCYRPGT
jgi:hypothetical protein